MNIGWCSIDGTLDYHTTGILGAGQVARIPLVHRFLQKHKLHWFGIRPNSHLIGGTEVSQIREYRKLLQELKIHFNFFWQKNKRRNGSRILYTFDNTVKKAIKNISPQLPKLDILFLQFQDINPLGITWQLFLMHHYVMRGIPVVVFDEDIELRYKSDIPKMYPAPIYRWLSPEIAQPLADIHLLSICSESNQDSFYHNVHEFYPPYDPSREINPIAKPYDIVYVGHYKTKINRNKAFHSLLYETQRQYNIAVFGKWPDRNFNRNYRRIYFGPPVGAEWLLHSYSLGLASVYLINRSRGDLGFLGYRAVEVPQAGSIMITPSSFVKPERFTLPQFIVDDVDELFFSLEFLKRAWGRGKYGSLVEEQRDLVRSKWSLDQAVKDLSNIAGVKL